MTTTPCCDCGGTEAEPWPEDPRYPMCTVCFHVCFHVCAHGYGDEPAEQPFRWMQPATPDDDDLQPWQRDLVEKIIDGLDVHPEAKLMIMMPRQQGSGYVELGENVAEALGVKVVRPKRYRAWSGS